MKNYEVKIDAQAVVLVIGAADSDEAYDYAKDALTSSSYSILEMSAREVADGDDLERTRRHADEISEGD